MSGEWALGEILLEQRELMEILDELGEDPRLLVEPGALERYSEIREEFPTFEAYCSERWDIDPAEAERLISVAEMIAEAECVADDAASEATA